MGLSEVKMFNLIQIGLNLSNVLKNQSIFFHFSSLMLNYLQTTFKINTKIHKFDKCSWKQKQLFRFSFLILNDLQIKLEDNQIF